MHEMEIKYSLYTPISICPLQIDAQESIVFNHDSVHQIQNHQRSHMRNKSTSVAVENGLRIFIFFSSQRLIVKLFNLICWEWLWSSFTSCIFKSDIHRPLGQLFLSLVASGPKWCVSTWSNQLTLIYLIMWILFLLEWWDIQFCHQLH